MLTLEGLRKISLEKQCLDNIKEGQKRITEAENRLAEAAKRGYRSVDVCVLRGGIHFDGKFDLDQNPKYLGSIGKTIYNHFSSRGFKVSFKECLLKEWMDFIEMGEFSSDRGYKVIVSW